MTLDGAQSDLQLAVRKTLVAGKGKLLRWLARSRRARTKGGGMGCGDLKLKAMSNAGSGRSTGARRKEKKRKRLISESHVSSVISSHFSLPLDQTKNNEYSIFLTEQRR